MDTPIFNLVRYMMNYCELTNWECSLYYQDCNRDHFHSLALTD